MLLYAIRRILYAIPILFGVILLTFTLFYVINTPDALAIKELQKAANPETVRQWKIQKGFCVYTEEGLRKTKEIETGRASPGTVITDEDIRPVAMPVLFLRYGLDLLTFDFGRDRDDRPVSQVLLGGMVPSLKMMVPAFCLSEIITIFLALFCALYRGTKIDRAFVVLAVFLMSFNSVALILFFQKFLAADWRYFPISGYDTGLSGYAYLALPILIYVGLSMGVGIRFNRILMLDEIHQDYVRTARAKGLGENTVLFRHVLRNALIPLITRWAVSIPFLYLGSLLLETFFGIPGLGGITLEAIQNADLNTMRAVVFLGALLFVLANLTADILYGIVDPRVRVG
ncbi:MAG TPA: ABC transporter permease [bacterium]|nr:ABC transporter permease [bacterium]HQO34154.1 ABC transporter permease [bacterium]HQQ00140.1 ABC transporter permease [bacterium]